MKLSVSMDFFEFLDKEKLPETLISQLRENGVGLEELEHLSIDSLTQHLNFTRANAAIVIQKKQEYLKKLADKSIKSETPRENTTHVRDVCEQEPRRFLQFPAPDFHYVRGNILGIENASGLSPLERSMEFKDCRNGFDPDWFVQKLRIYAVACINARINGTMYFGVADDKSAFFQSRHGEITGVPIQRDKLHVIQEVMDTHFLGASPLQVGGHENRRVKKMLKNCIQPARCIPVRDQEGEEVPTSGSDNGASSECRVVIEIDIEPSWRVCRKEVMFVRTKEDAEKQFYIRSGTNSCRQNFPNDHAFDEFKRDVEDSAERRRELEKNNLFLDIDRDLRLSFCDTGQTIPLENNKYILLIDELGEPKDHREFNWIKHFDFHLIVEFSKVSLESKFAKDYNKFSPEGLQGLLRDYENGQSIKDKLHADERQPWISTSPSLSDNDWLGNIKPILSKINMFMTLDTVLRNCRLTVLVLVDTRARIPKMAKILMDLYEAKRKIICIYSHANLKDEFKANLAVTKETFENMNHVICTDWNYFKDFMLHRLAKNDIPFSDTQRVPWSPGNRGIGLSSETFAYYRKRGIEILPMTDERGACFLGQTSLVKRQIETDLLSEIESLKRKSEQSVDSILLSHEPGSGATVSAKAVLWELKSKMRCLFIDWTLVPKKRNKDELDLIKDLAEHIVNWRNYRFANEAILSNNVTNVLVFLDNCDLDLAGELVEKLRESLKRRELHCTKPQIIVIAARRTLRLEQMDLNHFGQVMLRQSFISEEEKEMFATKISADAQDLNGMIDFVLRSNSEEAEDYLKRYVNCILLGSENNRPLIVLLRILCCLKMFIDCGLSLRMCSKYVDNSDLQIIKFLTTKQEDNIVQISSRPLCDHLLNSIKGSMNMVEVLKELIDCLLSNAGEEDLDSNESILKNLLVRKGNDLLYFPDLQPSETFSKLVVKLYCTNPNEAREFLLATHKRASENLKAYLARDLALLLLKDGQTEAGLEWIRKVVEKDHEDKGLLNSARYIRALLKWKLARSFLAPGNLNFQRVLDATQDGVKEIESLEKEAFSADDKVKLAMCASDHFLFIFEPIIESSKSQAGGNKSILKYLRSGEKGRTVFEVIDHQGIVPQWYEELRGGLIFTLKSLSQNSQKLANCETQLEKFRALFDEDLFDWTHSKLMERDASDVEKIRDLERLLPCEGEGYKKYFQRQKPFLRNSAVLLLLIERLSQASGLDLSIETQKAYLYVYFASKYKNVRSGPALSIKTVRYLCRELCDREESPIFHVFAIFLFWPRNKPDFEQKKSFCNAAEYLAQIKSEHPDPLFKITGSNHSFFVSVLTRGNKRVQKFKGVQNGVVAKLDLHGLSEPVRIPLESGCRRRRRFTDSTNVIFDLILTSEGLLACNVEQSHRQKQILLPLNSDLPERSLEDSDQVILPYFDFEELTRS